MSRLAISILMILLVVGALMFATCYGDKPETVVDQSAAFQGSNGLNSFARNDLTGSTNCAPPLGHFAVKNRTPRPMT